jgi:phage protein D
MTREEAVQRLSYRLAACAYQMLAEDGRTINELKDALMALNVDDAKFHADVVDDLLAARNPHKITCNLLADIAYLLGFRLEVALRPIDDR